MSALRRHLGGLHASLFLKLLAVMAAVAFLLNTLFAYAFRQARLEAGTRGAEQLVRQHVAYVLADLGDPPSEAKARAMAAQGIWKFRYLPASGSPRRAWASSDDVPYPSDLRGWMKGPDWGWRHGSFFVLHQLHGDSFLLLAEPWRGVRLAWNWRFLLVAGALCIVALAWLAMRWILLPVRWLDRGMARVAAGDLAHRIPTRERDELGRLAEQFNAMAARVQGMLEQRRQLLLDVSHELRTPLTRLKLGLEALPEGEERRGLADDVAELEGLVAELLEGARLEAGQDSLKRGPLDLAALAAEAAAAYGGREPGLTVSAPASLPFSGDAARLARLLHNLLANAFTHGQPASAPVELAVALAGDGADAVLTVRDHGPGVSAEDRSRLGSPFFRADRSRTRSTGGLGLGLHLCRRIAEAHGGSLDIEPGGGGGLLVRVRLSLA